MTFNAASLAASLKSVDRPATSRTSTKENPFAGVVKASHADGKARQVVVPVGAEKRGTKMVEHVTTVKTLIRNSAYADGVGVAMIVTSDDKNHTVTFWGKDKTDRPRKAVTTEAAAPAPTAPATKK
jgi:hypothetical protein